MSFEKSTNKIYNIQKMDEMLGDNRVRVDHPDQRLAEQWCAEYRDNLVADVLWGNPISQIVICEQMVKIIAEKTMEDMPVIVPMYWLIDGKQRATTLIKFRRNLFKLGKKIDRPFVKYIHIDNSGSEPVTTIETCDVRGKKYKDLPKELQDRFDLYELHAEQYLDCSDDDIDYHIRRYNRVKPMSSAQKGILYLGTETTRVVKRLAQHNFFRDNIGKYTSTDLKNGSIDRIITETLMATNFFPNWKKGNNDICAYLKEHVSVSALDAFEDCLNRLECVVTEDVADLFDNKNSFLFFTMFSKFTAYGKDDEEFVKFLSAFKTQLMGDWTYDGVTTYNTLSQKGSKDKAIVGAKLEILEKLMRDYFDIKEESNGLLIADRNLSKIVDEFSGSSIVKEVGLTEEETKTAVLRYVSDEAVPDEELQSYAYNASVTVEDVEDAGFNLDMLSSWVGADSGKINADNIATYLRFVKYAMANELSDKTVMKYLKGFDGSESFEVMVASLGDQTAA